MGNENSHPKFISVHPPNNNNNRQQNYVSSPQQQQQRNGSSDFINGASPIDKRAYYQKQDKRFSKLVNEERLRYISPPLQIFPSDGTDLNREGKLGQLPLTEIPSGIPGQPRTTLWPDPWVALLVRAGAIAPFSPGIEADPLSTSDFVSFMLQTIQQQPGAQNTKNENNINDENEIDEKETQEIIQNVRGGDLLAPPPPKPHEPNSSRFFQPSDPATTNNSNLQQQNTNEWLVIETVESKIPFVEASKPWPLEECCICLNMFDKGTNHCGRCHASICSECLLHIVKPVRIDVGNEANIKKAISKKKRCVERVAALIYQEERRLQTQLEKEEAIKRQMRKNDENIINNQQQLKQNIDNDDSLSLPNFARAALFTVTNAVQEVVATFNNNSHQQQKEQEDLPPEQADLLQAKRILELLKRTEVTGLFIRPHRQNSSRRSTRNHNTNNRDNSTTSTDSDDDDTTTRRRRQNENDDDDDDHKVVVDKDLERENFLIGKHHWPTPIVADFDTCEENFQQSILEQVKLIVQKAVRIESRGTCPCCNAEPAIWYFTGRKSRARMLFELCSQFGADPRVIRLFGEDEKKEAEEIRKSEARKKAGGDNVWIQPSAKEALEYEICIAVALSTMVSAVAENRMKRRKTLKHVQSMGTLAANLSSSPAEKSQPELNENQTNNNNNSSTNNLLSEEEETEQRIYATEEAIELVDWAKICPNCGNPNWKEFRCRVCRSMRM